jgi:hypothetical protein
MKEQVFFNDPALDGLTGIVLALAGEVYVLRDRVRALEGVLQQRGSITAEEVEQFPACDPAERDAFIARLLEPWLAGSKAGAQVDEAVVASFYRDAA